jgi:hypothetical protein
MPQLPRYESTRQIQTGGINAGVVRTSGNIAAAGDAISGVLRQRAENLAQQYDMANAVSAFNALREKSRGKLQELQAREGMAAQGVQQDYETWYPEAYNETSADFIKNDVQARVFERLASQNKESDLDGLATHELQQHRVHRKEALDGALAVTDTGIRIATNAALANSLTDATLKFASVDQHINEFLGIQRAMFPGHDLTSQEKADREALRVTQMEEIINTDPKSAKEYIEHYKLELGDSYGKLKKQMEGAVDDTVATAVYSGLVDKYGDDLEVAVDLVNNPKKWAELGINKASDPFALSKELDQKFRIMIGERDRREEEMRSDHDYYVKQNSSKFVADVLAGKNPDGVTMLRNRQLSPEVVKWAESRRENPTSDDPVTYYNLMEKISRGVDAGQDIIAASSDGSLKNETTKTLLKNQVDVSYQRAAAYITNALKPSDADKWTPGVYKRFADSLDSFHAALQSGAEPGQAARDVVNSVIGDMTLTVDSIPRPKYLTGQKVDTKALELAKESTIQAYNSEAISADTFRIEMQKIKDLIMIQEQTERMRAIEAGSKDVDSSKSRYGK